MIALIILVAIAYAVIGVVFARWFHRHIVCDNDPRKYESSDLTDAMGTGMFALLWPMVVFLLLLALAGKAILR